MTPLWIWELAASEPNPKRRPVGAVHNGRFATGEPIFASRVWENACTTIRDIFAAARILWTAAVRGAPAAARPIGQPFRIHSNALFGSQRLRLVLRTQPRSFGCGCAALGALAVGRTLWFAGVTPPTPIRRRARSDRRWSDARHANPHPSPNASSARISGRRRVPL